MQASALSYSPGTRGTKTHVRLQNSELSSFGVFLSIVSLIVSVVILLIGVEKSPISHFYNRGNQQ